MVYINGSLKSNLSKIKINVGVNKSVPKKYWPLTEEGTIYNNLCPPGTYN